MVQIRSTECVCVFFLDIVVIFWVFDLRWGAEGFILINVQVWCEVRRVSGALTLLLLRIKIFIYKYGMCWQYGILSFSQLLSWCVIN